MTLFFRRRLKGDARQLAETQVETIRAVQEGLGGIRDVIIDGSQDVFLRRFAELDRGWWRIQSSNALAGTAPRFAVEAVGVVLIAGLAYILVARTAYAAGALPLLGVIAMGAQRLLPLMQLVSGNWTLVLGNMGSAGAMLSVLESPSPTTGNSRCRHLCRSSANSGSTASRFAMPPVPRSCCTRSTSRSRRAPASG